jgi:hypothetical protein
MPDAVEGYPPALPSSYPRLGRATPLRPLKQSTTSQGPGWPLPRHKKFPAAQIPFRQIPEKPSVKRVFAQIYPARIRPLFRAKAPLSVHFFQKNPQRILRVVLSTPKITKKFLSLPDKLLTVICSVPLVVVKVPGIHILWWSTTCQEVLAT